MKVTLVGVKNIEAFETNDGKTVDGVKLFLAYSDENTYGNVAESKYIDRKVFNDFGSSSAIVIQIMFLPAMTG